MVFKLNYNIIEGKKKTHCCVFSKDDDRRIRTSGPKSCGRNHWAVEPSPQPIYNSLKPLSHIIIKLASHLLCSECYPAVM